MSRRHGPMAAVLGALCALLLLPALAAGKAATLPVGWPSAKLQLGMRDDEGGAAALAGSTKLGLRYHYLSGGVNTGRGWTTWAQGNGSFVTGFIEDSAANGFLPVFSYYQLRESSPGLSQGEEQGDIDNLRNVQTMKAWFNDLKLFFQRAGATGRTTVLHVEPDLWGYIQRRAPGGDPTGLQAAVASTGLSDLAGLPNTASGVARAVVRLRDRYAKHVLLGYHLSDWGTGTDISDADPSASQVDDLAAQAAAFYTKLGAGFDLIFGETANRDAAYRQAKEGDDRGWWNSGDFDRSARFIGDVANATGKRVVMWQTPLGNRLMQAMDNTEGHFQDSRVEWLLRGSASRAHLQAYVDAGVIAFLFGPALSGATCACDARHDGLTNPAPINGNGIPSLSADDDGGLFRSLARAYYQAGPLTLPAAKVSGGGPGAPAKRTHFTIRSSATKHQAKRGSTYRVTVKVRASRTTRAVVAVQFYKPGAKNPTGQIAYRGQYFRGGKTRTYSAAYRVPRSARTGEWTVKVGVFDPNFKKLWAWSERAASFQVH